MKNESIFLEVLGDSPVLKIVDFLLENRPFDYSKTEIAKNAEVGWSTLHGIWKTLERAKIVKQTRVVGKSKMFKLNEENPVVRKLIELDARISDVFAEQIIEEELKIPVSVKIKK
jgi:DNA-binding transcriptional ArsR family regulator